MIGQTLGHYQIVEKLGEGGMAEVYKAYEPGTDRYVAIKILLGEFSEHAEFRARFDLEARSTARLEHPHILPLYAYGEQDGRLYLVIRYLTGGTLLDYIETRGPRSNLEEVARFTLQLGSALDYAHAHGVLHRDIKPENVLLDAHLSPYLADFGLARLRETAINLTGNMIAGTPGYMAPEQAMGEELSPATDQYALAALLFEMLTGRQPFYHENHMALLQMHIRDVVPSPRVRRPDLPEAVDMVIFRGMAKQAADRYPSCSALGEAFNQVVEGGKGLRINDSKRVPKALSRRIDAALDGLQSED